VKEHGQVAHSKLEPSTFDVESSRWLKIFKFIRRRLQQLYCSNGAGPGLLVISVILRVILSRSIILNVQCSWDGVKVLSVPVPNNKLG
jgi:hypothetical protein